MDNTVWYEVCCLSGHRCVLLHEIFRIAVHLGSELLLNVADGFVCRTPLDVMRVDMESGGHRYAVCVASYGYMGDLMRLSERLRFLGPARYGIAGAITLLRGRAYDAEVWSQAI